MPILFDADKKIFHIMCKDCSYMFQILKDGSLGHLYFGKRLKDNNLSYLIRYEFRGNENYKDADTQSFSLDLLPFEFSTYGTGDYRHPSFQAMLKDGSTITSFKYIGHNIFKGKKALKGLPSLYMESEDEGQTLYVELYDEVSKLKAVLQYSCFENYNVITRSIKIINEGEKDVNIKRIMSFSIDFHDNNYKMLRLSGAWARERYVHISDIYPGIQSIESTRNASSPQQNPFIALLEKNADEFNGNVYGFNLVYSGSFLAEVEVNHFNMTRVSMGINPFDFNYLLKSGEDFQSPEAVMVFSKDGLNGMSSEFHNVYRNNLLRGKYKKERRPILINNWEATYFDFNEEKILNIAREAKDLGIELFVLDDGWFGCRNDDTTSLGDWYENKEKLPLGLEHLAKKINEMGMKFGLWFEPEMISPKSELYKKHKEWCIQVADREKTQGRHQFVLDLSREDVCNYIIDTLSSIFDRVPISYVKWDMNRHMTEIGSLMLPPERQRETGHRYILGLYYILETLTNKYKDILFESCSAGGGRFDPGMLYYMPQTWTSDDTDAIERIKIQYGTSIVYPLITMGCHVSAVPNHQVGRITSIETRGNIALSGNFGYELDISKLTDKEKDIIKKQIEIYKDISDIIINGRLYRIKSPFDGNDASWIIVSEDKERAVFFYCQSLSEPNPIFKRIKLLGLDENFLYEVVETKEKYKGEQLMYAGLNLPNFNRDFESILLRFKKVD